MLILIADLIWREKGHGALGWLTLLGFVLAFAATLSIWGANVAIFANMYVVDLFSLFFKLLATITGIFIVLVSIDYLRGRTPYRGDFFALFTFAILAMVMMASSASLLMIYLSVEFLSYMSYLLTGFLREDKKSNEAAIKYFLYGAITSAVMLYGLSLLYGISGSLNLNDIAKRSRQPSTRPRASLRSFRPRSSSRDLASKSHSSRSTSGHPTRTKARRRPSRRSCRSDQKRPALRCYCASR